MDATKLENIETSIKSIIQAAMALNNDTKIYYSGDQSFSTESRRGLLVEDIRLIKLNIEKIDTLLSASTNVAQ
jgi:hypothetical protein